MIKISEFRPTELGIKPDTNLIIPEELKPGEKIIKKERLTPDSSFRPNE